MMYGVKKFSLVSAAFGLTMFAACGDEGNTEVTDQAGISMLDAGQSMPECDSESAGNIVYAADSTAVYYCADGKWLILNGKDDAGCSVGAPSTNKDGNTVVAVTCGETSKTLTIAKGDLGETGVGCSVGESSTDKDGNTIVVVTCGETSKTLTVAKGNEGETGAGCSVGAPSSDKDGNTVVAVTCGETSKTLTIAKGDQGEATSGCKAEDQGNGKVVVTCGEGDDKTEQTLYKAVCGTKGYDPAEAFCFKNEIYDKCNAQIYNPTEASCFEGKIYSCDNNPYNPTTHYCRTLKDKGGEEKATVEELLIDSRDEANVQVYKTVKICDEKQEECQTWMAENLNYGGVQSWCGGGDGTTEGDCSMYGRLYTWEVAIDKADCCSGSDCENSNEGVQGVCPEGWHLPSYDEFGKLINFIDPLFVYDLTSEAYSTTAGKYLKSQSGWNSSGDGTDSYGFSALPGGYRYNDGYFFNEGYLAYFWSSDESNSYYAFYLSLNNIDENADLLHDDKDYAMSVRCIKN